MTKPTLRPGSPSERLHLAAAWSVHLLTSLGVVVGFLAMVAAFNGDDRACFLWLFVALIIDSIDGTLARAAHVKHVIPWVDGEVLDNIVDYFTYVIVPTAIFVRPGMLPAGFEWVALTVLVASAYGFSRTDAKGFVEHYFQGFPSYWNVVAFYFVVLQTPPLVNLIWLTTLVVLVFVPMRWLYPSRMEGMDNTQRVTIGLGLAWALMGLTVLITMPDHSRTLAMASLFYPAYYAIGSVVYHFRSR
ncbi:MAG: phosphatidylcholine synthase [Hyphomicrobiaceae bacterium]|jgi:phosphatidylcholine synthase